MLRSRFEAVGNKSTDQFLEFEHLKFSVHSFFATHARFWYAPLWSARHERAEAAPDRSSEFQEKCFCKESQSERVQI